MSSSLWQPPGCRRWLRFRTALGAFAASAFVSAHPSAFAQASASSALLTLQQSLQLAQQRSAVLVAQDSEAASARSMAIAAGQLPDAALKVGLDNLPVTGPDQFSVARDFMTMRSVGVMQEFTRSSKRKARAARFEHEAGAAEANREVALANLQRDTASAWLDRYYQEQMRELLVAQRDEAKLQIDAADAAYRGGRGSQADAFAARSAVAQIEDRLAQAERDIAIAKTQLARRIGEAAEQVLAPPPPLESVNLRLQDLETTIAHHPQIAVMLEQEATAQAQADAARADKRPDVSIELMYSQRGSAYSNMVSINVSIPLQWDQKHRQDQELAAKLALVRKVRAEREEETRMHVAEARSMLQQWQSDRDRLVRYDADLLPLAAGRTAASLVAYRGKTGSLTAVLEARRSEIETRTDRLRLQMETARLWARLNYLVPAGHHTTEDDR